MRPLFLVVLLTSCNASMDPLPFAGGGGAGGSGGSSAGSGGGAAGATTGAPDAAPTGETLVTLEGRVVDLENQLPIGRARVRVENASNLDIAETASDGRFFLQIPGQGDVPVRVERDGYVPERLLLRPAGMPVKLAIVHLLASTSPDLTGGSSMGSDDTLGHVLARAVADETGMTGVEGVTLTMTPMPVTPPLYYGPAYERDESRTSTAIAGAALFRALPPGDVEVLFAHPSLTCRPLHGVAGAQPGSVRVQVMSGTVTSVLARCAAP